MAVPRKLKKETMVQYHDRLAELAKEANEQGDLERSRKLQRAAGKIASQKPRVRATARGDSPGPGTYPWEQCVKEQRQAGYDHDVALKVCGKIRADSRRRYPEYWAERENKGQANPVSEIGGQFGGNPKSDGRPFVGLALDGGPHLDPDGRDHIFVLDKGGAVLESYKIMGAEDLQSFNEKYPDLPVFGPLKVIAGEVRRLRRASSKGVTMISRRR